jgi:alpha-N-arabinofuranosidase
MHRKSTLNIWRHGSAFTLCRQTFTIATLAATFAGCTLAAQQKPSPSATLTIDPGKIVSPVSPTLYGMMTEEINHSYDGGLYAELIQNRTFRGSWEGVEHWGLVRLGDAQATMSVDKENGPSTALPYSLKLTATEASPQSAAGLSNSGYWGIGMQPHTSYKGSFYAKVDDAGIDHVVVKIINDRTGAVLAQKEVPLHVGPWSQYQFTLDTGALAPSTDNHLQLTIGHAGTLRLQLVSLMPPTYHDRPNGNRPDLMERMAGLHPHFLRLPGGNYLEGDRLQDWYNWKETIGPLVDRPGHQAPWTYWSTDGLGLLEFLEWCEDLKIEPVLAVYAGYSLKGAHVNPGKDLDPYVQSNM